MSYGIVRVQKFQAGSVKGIEIHDRRDKDHSHTNKEIDFEKSKSNFVLHEVEGTFRQAVKERIEKLQLQKAVRKDAVVMAQVLVTSDHEFFDKLTPDQTKAFFQQSYDFLVNRYGKGNVISATVHMDERTPHMHFNFVPVTEDGRLSAKLIFNRMDLIRQQDDFFNQVGQEWGLLRGERDGYKTHLETAELKKQTAYKDLKELTEKKIALENDLKALEPIKDSLKGLDEFLTKKPLLGKISLSIDELDSLVNASKTGIVKSHKVSDLTKEIDRLQAQIQDERKQANSAIKKLRDQVKDLGENLMIANQKLDAVRRTLKNLPDASRNEFQDLYAYEKSMIEHESNNTTISHNEVVKAME